MQVCLRAHASGGKLAGKKPNFKKKKKKGQSMPDRASASHVKADVSDRHPYKSICQVNYQVARVKSNALNTSKYTKQLCGSEAMRTSDLLMMHNSAYEWEVAAGSTHEVQSIVQVVLSLFTF